MNAWLSAMSPDARMAFWTVLVASLCGLMCAWLGVWLVLRRQSMVGDAISHSVLPGLVLVFLAFGTREPLPMLAGAAAAGLLSVVVIRLLSQFTSVREDASMGIVFTVFFAVGVILITRYAGQVDLDPGCVLYGLIEFVSIDTVPFLGAEVPAALVNIVPALIVIAVVLLLLRKELLIGAFDPRLAATLGQRPGWVDLGLMALVAIATVAAFEAVGSILVIALLVGPAATAQLLTRRLRPMFLWASVIVVVACVLGYILAVRWNTSVAGMIAVSVGGCYVLAALLSPQGGVLRARKRGA